MPEINQMEDWIDRKDNRECNLPPKVLPVFLCEVYYCGKNSVPGKLYCAFHLPAEDYESEVEE